MNVHLPPPRIRVLLFPVIVLLGAVAQLSAQNGAYKNLTTAVNTEVTDTISGINLMIYKVSPVAKHGDMVIDVIQSGGSGSPHIYEISYTPDPGFVGVDTFTLQLTYVNTFPYLIYQAYRVSVFPSLLTPRPDYSVTSVGTPVTIDVLANDTGSSGPLTVASLPLVNNGTATVNASNQIVFTPTPGFMGVAHANYVVCDALNHCKTGQINIGVNNSLPPADDTLWVATAKNTKLTIPLAYSGYTLFQSPPNGMVTLENGQSFKYTPNTNYTGTDQFVLVNNASGTAAYKTVSIDVLNTPTQNMMAMDDYVFTPKGQAIKFNVRDNDIGNLLVKSWVTPPGLPGTISGTTGGGKVTFTPNADFTGVATFYYRIGNSQISNLEMAAVNVIVGNLNPMFATFDMTTPKETPFVINYRIPFIGFNFSVVDAPDNGFCSFYPGYTTQTINGQNVSGYNLLVYTPDDNFTGTDEFEIKYCVTANGQCRNVKINMNVTEIVATEAPYCVDDCVWAGDVNNDGIVNNKDLLPLGYYMGIGGLVREDASLEWYGQYADSWNNPFTGNPMDVKHADTDGSGAITNEDTLAIGLFYGQTHNLMPHIPPVSKNLPFFLKVLTPDPQVGDLVEVEVSLGNNSLPVSDLYGFTFDVSLSPSVVDSAFNMTYYDNSWLNLNAPSLWIDKNPQQGRLETAFTRTNGVPTNGYGVIGKFEFIIIDVILGGKPDKGVPSSFAITIDNPSFLSGNGSVATGNSYSIEIPLGGKERSQQTTTTDSDFFVYPSPANDRLRVHLNGSDIIESLSIFDARGREVYTSGNVHLEFTELNISDLPQGVYVAAARTSTGKVTKKFQVLR